MFEGVLEKVAVGDMDSLRAATPLGEEGTIAVQDATAVGQGVDLLAGRGLLADSVQLLAHALPGREGVWWACRCAREIGQEDAGVERAERWAADSSEENRRACQSTYEELGLETPGAVAALAAFLNGKSLAPAGLPEVPPAPFHASKAVAGAVLLASVIKEPEKSEERLRRFLEVGEAVAAGKDRWAKGSEAAAASREQDHARPEPKRPAPRKLDTWE